MMEPFLEEIVATFDSAIYSTALASALIVPDAAGAIEYPRARGSRLPSNRERYVAWFDSWVGSPPLPGGQHQLDGAFVWKLRNMMMHETALDIEEYGFHRVIFSLPNRQRIQIDMAAMHHMGPQKESALNLDLAIFIGRIIESCRRWLASVQGDPNKLARMDGLIQLRPVGRAPFIVGLPLIS